MTAKWLLVIDKNDFFFFFIRNEYNCKFGKKFARRINILNLCIKKWKHCHRRRKRRSYSILGQLPAANWGGSSNRRPFRRNKNSVRRQRVAIANRNHEKLHFGRRHWDWILSSNAGSHRRSLGSGCPPHATSVRNCWPRQTSPDVGQLESLRRVEQRHWRASSEHLFLTWRQCHGSRMCIGKMAGDW